LAGGGWSGCAEWAVSNQADGWGFSSLLGYVYRAKIDRARVVSKTTSDGRGTSSTITFSYSGVGLSDDGKEFRGHATVRATDVLGNYTDTCFHQDDARKGRPSQSETHASYGSLFIKLVNSWSTSTTYHSVTLPIFLCPH